MLLLTVGVARVMLILTFGLAALGKFRGISSFRVTLQEFGVGTRLSLLLQWIVPAAEFGIAVALLRGSAVRFAAACALTLLTIFALVLLRNLIAGRHPPCNCFGQHHSQPISWHTLVRNALLGGCAVVLIAADTSRARLVPTRWWLQHTSAIVAVLAGVMVLQLWVIVLLVAQRGQMLVRLERLESPRATETPQPAHGTTSGRSHAVGLPTGSPAPDFALAGSDGELVSLASLRAAGKPVLLVFSDPSCGPCKAVLPDIAARQQDSSDPLTIAVITQGPAPATLVRQSVKNLLWQRDHEIADSYLVQGTPAAVLVSADGLVASAPAGGAEQVRSLLNRPTRSDDHLGNGHSHLPVSSKGPPNPPVLGERVSRIPTLTEVLGTDALDALDSSVGITSDSEAGTMLLFWNPSCGFCQQLLPDLQRLVREEKLSTVRTVVVSRGSLEENAQVQELFETLLDPDMQIMHRAHVSGTPIAIMFDSEGSAVSGVATGGRAVLDLARSLAPVR